MANRWFEVDKEGLAKLLERRGKAFILHELFQNAWDEDSKNVDATLEMLPGRPMAKLVITDDNPKGFADLRHAFTLFAESYKKDLPEKRGRFDIGEKLVLACCEEARIISTTGSVIFTKEGERKTGREKTDFGTRFEALVRMTRAEFEEVNDAVRRLISPEGIHSTYNGVRIPSRAAVATFRATLLTEKADENRVLRRVNRETTVKVYDVLPGETAHIYEMGIPVVETGDKFHVDVQQKVPVNLERENVPPSYLRTLRTLTLNHTFNLVRGEEATNAAWVRDALEDKNVDKEAVKHVVTERFGENAVAFDPSDPEANKLSTLEGRPVIYGGTFGAGAWNNIRAAGALPSAGTVTPSPKPFSPDGKPLKIIPPTEWSDGMKAVVEYTAMLARELMGVTLPIAIANDSGWPYGAVYGKESDRSATFYYNVGRLGYSFFENFPLRAEEVDRLIIHEFGHQYASDHFSREYYDALCKLGARLKGLALTKPEKFHAFYMQTA